MADNPVTRDISAKEKHNKLTKVLHGMAAFRNEDPKTQDKLYFYVKSDEKRE